MKKRIDWVGFLAMGLMVLFILDSENSVNYAREGIEICLSTVIPSLFPFIVLSGVITSAFSGIGSIFRLPARLCNMPYGSESLLLTGWLGGYPVGAQSVYIAFKNGHIQKADAERLLGFCNNAGPAFIFGITLCIFDSPVIPWFLWGIQILSSLITGIILPGKASPSSPSGKVQTFNVSESLVQAVRSTGIICGWVIIARIIIGFCEYLVLRSLPAELSVFLKGFIELSNGCVALNDIESEQVRFVFCSVMLTFGGLSVWMQTQSIVAELSVNLWFRGKLLQTLVSLMLSWITAQVLFRDWQTGKTVVVILIGIVILLLLVFLLKKVVAFKKKMLYNV